MKKYLCLLIILLFSCNNNDENKIAIVIHGGAGIILKENISKSKEDSIINKLDEAISKGWELLKDGKSSELAVIETIKNNLTMDRSASCISLANNMVICVNDLLII